MTSRKLAAMVLFFTFLLPLISFAGRMSESEELEKLIRILNERQSRNKQFEKKTKAYFYDTQKSETIEGLVKEFQPGDTITIIVFSNLSKRPVKDIAAMKKAGVSWIDIAGKLKINLKAAVKEVKDFRLGIG